MCNTVQMLITTIILGILVNKLSDCNTISIFWKLLMECKSWISIYLAVGIIKIAIEWGETRFQKLLNKK